MARKLPPVHPGEILQEEFLAPVKLTPYAVAAALNVPRAPQPIGSANATCRQV
jgi:antitoxin HigA-1